MREAHRRVFEMWRWIWTPRYTPPTSYNELVVQSSQAYDEYKRGQDVLRELVERAGAEWRGRYPDLVPSTRDQFWEIELTRIDNLDHELPWEDRLRPPVWERQEE